MKQFYFRIPMWEVIKFVPHNLIRQLNMLHSGYDETDVRKNYAKKGYNTEVTERKLCILEVMQNPWQEIHILFPGDIDHDDLCGICTTVRIEDACDEKAAAIRSGQDSDNWDARALLDLGIHADDMLTVRELLKKYEELLARDIVI
ncbi:TPA: hypothetical protein DIS60_00450 [Patescibacteria group bacterium]|nr:hypothetical protein [Patescibacteria group bacterium]